MTGSSSTAENLYPTPWVETEPDIKQFGRQLGPRVFEFKERRCMVPPGRVCADDYQDFQMIVDLGAYTTSEIEDYICGFYDSIGVLKDVSGDRSEWIMAECILAFCII